MYLRLYKTSDTIDIVNIITPVDTLIHIHDYIHDPAETSTPPTNKTLRALKHKEYKINEHTTIHQLVDYKLPHKLNDCYITNEDYRELHIFKKHIVPYHTMTIQTTYEGNNYKNIADNTDSAHPKYPLISVIK